MLTLALGTEREDGEQVIKFSWFGFICSCAQNCGESQRLYECQDKRTKVVPMCTATVDQENWQKGKINFQNQNANRDEVSEPFSRNFELNKMFESKVDSWGESNSSNQNKPKGVYGQRVV